MGHAGDIETVSLGPRGAGRGASGLADYRRPRS
jgi:hypothetical protein